MRRRGAAATAAQRCRLRALAATQARKRTGACAPQGLASATTSAAASPQRSVTSFPVELLSGQSTPAGPASSGRPGASPAPAAAGPAAAQAAAALAAADRALANVARPPSAAKSGLGVLAGGAPRDREAAAPAAASDDPASLSTVKTLLDKIASIPPAGAPLPPSAGAQRLRPLLRSSRIGHCCYKGATKARDQARLTLLAVTSLASHYPAPVACQTTSECITYVSKSPGVSCASSCAYSARQVRHGHETCGKQDTQ